MRSSAAKLASACTAEDTSPFLSHHALQQYF
jgi:hypothetical protein